MNKETTELWAVLSAREMGMKNMKIALDEYLDELQKKEAVIQQQMELGTHSEEKERELVQLRAAMKTLSIERTARSDAEAQVVAMEAKLQEKDRQMQDKEDVIREQEKALTAYRLTFRYVPILKPMAKMAGLARNTIKQLGPRLGKLNHYAPQPLLLDYSQGPNLNTYPTISIVTPSYQQGEFIEKTILSVLDQQYPKLEFFVQDGGSLDSTVNVLKDHDQHLSGWVSESDSGQSQAINRGLVKASGDILAWLNSDDLLLPGSLEAVADFFNQHPDVDVVYGNRVLVDAEGMEIGRWILPGHDSEVLSWADFIPQETMFWRRQIWEKIGGEIDESYKFAMDWDLLVRFREAGATFAHIPRFLGGFRIHQQQKTSAAIDEIGHAEMDRIRSRTLGEIPSHPEIRKALRIFMLKHMLVDMGYRIKMRLGFGN